MEDDEDSDPRKSSESVAVVPGLGAYVTCRLRTSSLRGTVCFLSVCLWPAVPGYTTIVFVAGVPREASCLPVLWTELPVWTEGGDDHLFISSSAWKDVGGNSPYPMGLLRSVIVISMCLRSISTHRNTYLGKRNNREKGTSNDNDYYHCSGDVGKVMNQLHAGCFPPHVSGSACNLQVEEGL